MLNEVDFPLKTESCRTFEMTALSLSWTPPPTLTHGVKSIKSMMEVCYDWCRSRLSHRGTSCAGASGGGGGWKRDVKKEKLEKNMGKAFFVYPLDSRVMMILFRQTTTYCMVLRSHPALGDNR